MNNINFAQTIIEQSRNYPNKLAYRDGTDLTYGELCVRIQQVAQGLSAKGLCPGDNVVLIMEDCVDWPAVFLACVYIGVVPLTLSTVVSLSLIHI
jgi:benzoate-CoA ligase